MKIVKFKDGTFAVRKFSFFDFCYMYKDLSGSFWWDREEDYFNKCKGSLENVQAVYQKISDKGVTAL